MGDLISRHGVSAWLDNLGYSKLSDYVMDEDRFPSAQPKRKNGKWIFLEPNGFKCSRCGRYLGIEYGDVKMNFCPHCGSYNGEGDNYVWL